MTVSDQELRALVREVIAGQARQTGVASPVSNHPAHPGLGLLPLARGTEGDGACLIEPTVRCQHCGYCVSYGH